MFELYDKNNNIPDKLAKEIYKFMIDNYCNRKEYFGRPRTDFETQEKYDMWLKMINNYDDYYILIYYYNGNAVAFTSYAFMEKGICLCEIQIKEDYQGKYDILRKMLKYIMNIDDCKKFNNVCGGINNNQRSVNVFTYIGMKNTEKNWYEISTCDLMKWVNKVSDNK